MCGCDFHAAFVTILALSFVTVNTAIVSWYFLRTNHQEMNIVTTMLPLTLKPRLALFIISSNITKHRIKPLMDMWGNRIRNHSSVSDFFIFALEDKSIGDYPSIDVPDKYQLLYPKLRFRNPKSVDVQLTIKDAYAMEYCVMNTSANWCLRLMDDLFVNDEGFDEFISYLETLRNPYSYPMVLGNCMSAPADGYYLQGGSGYAFSRRAAELMVDYQNEWITSVNCVEDMHLTAFLNWVNITSEETDCPFFTGHFIRWAWWQRFNWSDPVDFPDCPTQLEQEKFCAHRLVEYHKVAFVHALKTYMGQKQWYDWFANMPRDAGLYYWASNPRICRLRVNTSNSSSLYS